MKTRARSASALFMLAVSGVTTPAAHAEESTILLDDFETHATNYLDPPWTGMPNPEGYVIWNNPRVGFQGSKVVLGFTDRYHEGAMRPMPFAFDITQSSILFQFDGRTTTNGEPYDSTGSSLSQLEFRNATGDVCYFAFGLDQDHYNGGSSADPPFTALRDGEGTLHTGDSLEPETWYQFRGLIDWTETDAQNRHGLFTLQYREVGTQTWITDSSLSNRTIKVADPTLATQLAVRVDQYGPSDWQCSHQGQMDNIRYQAPTTDTMIGFETSEGYTAGLPPIVPWQLTPTEQPNIRVTSDIKHGDDQSLAIGSLNSERAVFPVDIPPGGSASFSIWIRPGFHTANYETLGSVGVRELDTVSNYWDSNPGLTFENNIDHYGTGGSTQFSLLCSRSGYFIDRSGDFTPGNWYQVQCSITDTDIIYSVRMDTGTVVNTVPRLANYRIDQIVLGGSFLSTAYFDEFIYSAPPVPVSLTVASAHGSPNPAVGAHSYDMGTVVNAMVEDVTDGLSQQACTGWAGTGSVPTNGSGKQLEFTMNAESTLTWNWETRHWLEVSVIGNGSVNQPSAFLAADSTQNLVATGDAGWLFVGWNGDLSGTDANASLTITGPLTVTAIFSDDADGDGLTNEEETALGSNPWNSDTDGDGFDDKLEADHGGSPTVSDAWRVDHIRANGSKFDLYPSDVVLDLDLGQLMFEVLNGQATLHMQMMQSDNLTDWSEAGAPVQWQLPVNPEKGFFRLKVSE